MIRCCNKEMVNDTSPTMRFHGRNQPWFMLPSQRCRKYWKERSNYHKNRRNISQKRWVAAMAKNEVMLDNQEMSALLTTSTPVIAAATMSSSPPLMKKGIAQAPALAQSHKTNA